MWLSLVAVSELGVRLSMPPALSYVLPIRSRRALFSARSGDWRVHCLFVRYGPSWRSAKTFQWAVLENQKHRLEICPRLRQN